MDHVRTHSAFDIPRRPVYVSFMRPLDIQQIGDELAIKWDDQSESFIKLEKLRRLCPCAGCNGEKDIFGNVYKNPTKPYSAKSFQLVRLAYVGGYALQPHWADGHGSGLFAYDYLKRAAESNDTDIATANPANEPQPPTA
ncbi:MAG: DUF971 domain-containing protein [Verrucomicrobiota bacterium]